jgi:catechol 2,3-dioxygenase
MSQSLQLRSVHLRVEDLTRSLRFYVDQLGFTLLSRSKSQAELGTGSDTASLLTLTQDASAPLAQRDSAGLFHAALLLPNRATLGHWLRTTAEAGVNFEGFSDHGVSEAVYLSDPDDNGLEFYVDRPRDQWPFRNGELQMGTAALAVPDLLAAGAHHEGHPLTGARWGHLHLRVTDLERSEAFYNPLLGLQRMQRFGPNARFLAADGYHHHLGMNNWGGVTRPRDPLAIGLVEATFAHRDVREDKVLKDPDGITIRVTALKDP